MKADLARGFGMRLNRIRDISQSISLHEQETELLHHPKTLRRGDNE